jgi:hypothetical protein
MAAQARPAEEDPDAAALRVGGRFASAYDDPDELLRVVAVVARVARPHAPQQATTRQWDAARVRAHHGDAPSARAICMRLSAEGTVGVSWPDVVAAAVRGGRAITDLLRVAQRVPEGPHLSAAHVSFALRLAARHLDKPTLTPDEYARGRDALIRADRRRRDSPSLLANLLPTVGQVIAICETWDAALDHVGMEPRPAQSPQGGRAALEGVDAAEVYLECAGCLPTRYALDAFTKRHGIAVRRIRDSWPDVIEQLRRRRAAQGLWTPAAIAPKHERLTPLIPEGGFAHLPARATIVAEVDKRRRTYEGLLEFDALQARAGARRTETAYRRAVPDHPHWQWPSLMRSYGTFSAVLADARAWDAAGRPDLNDPEPNAAELQAGGAVMTNSELAADLGCSLTDLNRWLRSTFPPAPGRRRPATVTAAEVEAARAWNATRANRGRYRPKRGAANG